MLVLTIILLNVRSGYADSDVYNEMLTLNLEEVTFDEVVTAIENQSEYVFFYKSSDVDHTIEYDVELDNKSINEILNQLTNNSALTYRISGKYIFIEKKTESTKEADINKITKILQQVRQISGTVLDEQGIPVIGANVIENGTTNGTVTDIDGNFQLQVANDAVVTISYIGYLDQQLNTTGTSSFNVVLFEDTQTLDELVVVGYGTMRKSDVTGSISTARGSDIVKNQSFNALEGLKGKAAGVNIFSNTGQPGGELRVIIRGISTINASASPLYVVDGVVMSNFQYLNPNDIESIEVLKDASSAAIYGARGEMVLF